MKSTKLITGIRILLIGIMAGGAIVWLVGGERTAEQKQALEAERKVLFYRNPMNPEVTSPVPMKDQ
ncbi:MAG: efflux transporter periplasmic adaptor subunit, partial [Deltaproteobacteria bacterium]|nr:efflux transporter periplasmic adaptor subunit [Deltaproteobacteria bacterium]